MAFERFESALSGLKVIDLTQARAGPAAVRQLADWGADVVRIEPPVVSVHADLGRRHGPDFQNLHRNKRGIAIDLKVPEGRDVLLRMAAGADVLIENFRPDVKSRLRIDYPVVSKLNPRIVYASISGFGQDGPWADRGGLDQIAQGMGGHMMITGEPGRGPMRSGAAISDMFSGILCANAVLTALLDREKSGLGQWVQTSLLEAQIFLLDSQAARWTMDRDLPEQEGNHHPTIAPMGVFKTQDGLINIAPLAPMWKKFCAVLDTPHLLHDERYATRESRCAHRGDLIGDIEKATVTRSSEAWIEAFHEAGIPCGPIYTIAETFEHEQVKHLKIAQTVSSAALEREVTLIGQPIHMSRSQTRIQAPAPECGEHTNEIMQGLGYRDDEIERLRGLKVIM